MQSNELPSITIPQMNLVREGNFFVCDVSLGSYSLLPPAHGPRSTPTVRSSPSWERRRGAPLLIRRCRCSACRPPPPRLSGVSSTVPCRARWEPKTVASRSAHAPNTAWARTTFASAQAHPRTQPTSRYLTSSPRGEGPPRCCSMGFLPPHTPLAARTRSRSRLTLASSAGAAPPCPRGSLSMWVAQPFLEPTTVPRTRPVRSLRAAT